VNFGSGWPTNWQLQGSAFLTGNPGKVGTFIASPSNGGDPYMFQLASTGNATDINQLTGAFRDPFPGESGQRNILRGPGFFGIDAGVNKSWRVHEGQTLKFVWQVFNVTNSVRFDAAGSASVEALSDIGSFGKYSATLTQARRMEFALRYTF